MHFITCADRGAIGLPAGHPVMWFNLLSGQAKAETAMLIHDDIYAWEGFGGLFKLASGRCRLRIFDLGRGGQGKVTPLKPYVVVVNDLADETARPSMRRVSVRSCCSHIATGVARDFKIDPHRMIFVEYYPGSTYGENNRKTIPAKFDSVDFTWSDGKALHPKWRALEEPLRSTVKALLEAGA